MLRVELRVISVYLYSSVCVFDTVPLWCTCTVDLCRVPGCRSLSLAQNSLRGRIPDLSPLVNLRSAIFASVGAYVLT